MDPVILGGYWDDCSVKIAEQKFGAASPRLVDIVGHLVGAKAAGCIVPPICLCQARKWFRSDNGTVEGFATRVGIRNCYSAGVTDCGDFCGDPSCKLPHVSTSQIIC